MWRSSMAAANASGVLVAAAAMLVARARVHSHTLPSKCIGVAVGTPSAPFLSQSSPDSAAAAPAHWHRPKKMARLHNVFSQLIPALMRPDSDTAEEEITCSIAFYDRGKALHATKFAPQLLIHFLVLAVLQFLLSQEIVGENLTEGSTSSTFMYTLLGATAAWVTIPYIASWRFSRQNTGSAAHFFDHQHAARHLSPSNPMRYVLLLLMPRAACFLHRIYLKQDDRGNGASVDGFKVILRTPVLLHILYLANVLVAAAAALVHHSEVQGEEQMAGALRYLHLCTLGFTSGTMLFYALTACWRPTGESAELHGERVRHLTRVRPAAAQLRAKAMAECDAAGLLLHERHVKRHNGLTILWCAGLAAAMVFSVFRAHEWPDVDTMGKVSAVVLASVSFMVLVVLHNYLLNSYTYGGRHAILLQMYLTGRLRALADDPSDHTTPTSNGANNGHGASNGHGLGACARGHNKVVELVNAWLQARIFLQREDINLFFGSVSPMVGLLIVMGASASLTILGTLFRFYSLPTVTLGVVVALGVWSLGASYAMVYFALGISRSTVEQLRVLENLRLLRWAAGDASDDEIGLKGAIAQVGSFLREHDHPPTILGVEVTPKLLAVLNHYVSGVVMAYAVSYVSDHLHGAPSDEFE